MSSLLVCWVEFLLCLLGSDWTIRWARVSVTVKSILIYSLCCVSARSHLTTTPVPLSPPNMPPPAWPSILSPLCFSIHPQSQDLSPRLRSMGGGSWPNCATCCHPLVTARLQQCKPKRLANAPSDGSDERGEGRATESLQTGPVFRTPTIRFTTALLLLATFHHLAGKGTQSVFFFGFVSMINSVPWITNTVSLTSMDAK